LEGDTFVPQRVRVGVAREALAQHVFWTNNQLPAQFASNEGMSPDSFRIRIDIVGPRITG